MAVVSCGSDGFHPSAPGSEPLDQLSDDQANALCAEAYWYAESLTYQRWLEETCRYQGVVAAERSPATATDAQVRSACRAAYDACRRAPPVREPGSGPGTCTTTFDLCPATVDQFAVCFQERVASSTPTCDGLTVASVAEWRPGYSGPACATFSAVCPGIFPP